MTIAITSTPTSDTADFFAALEQSARSNPVWKHPVFDELRSGHATPDELRLLLIQYFYYVERFASRLCALAGRATEEQARLAVARNIFEEMGGDDGQEATHLNLIRRLLRDTGAEQLLTTQPPLPTTRIAEMYFQGLCVDGTTWDALFAMGPGTEAVSQLFLDPMELAVEKTFGMLRGTVPYFVVHYPETDMAHAEAIKIALVSYLSALPEQGRQPAMAQGQGIVGAAVMAHGLLFEGVWHQWRGSTLTAQV